MTWILLSLLYAVTNAVYTTYNETRNFNGYVLGIWRGFGISLLVAPLLFTVPPVTSASYYLILVIQGLMIGIYDSHLFFASGKYGATPFRFYGHLRPYYRFPLVGNRFFRACRPDVHAVPPHYADAHSERIFRQLLADDESPGQPRRRRIPLPRRLRPRIDEHCHAVYCPQRRHRLCRCRLLPYGRLLCQRRLQCRDVRPPENTPSAATTVIPAARPARTRLPFCRRTPLRLPPNWHCCSPRCRTGRAHGSLPSVRC